MKKLLPLFIFASFTAIAQPAVISAPVDHLYIPAGFDSNDSVEVVVTGTFPNPCYSRNDVKVAVTDDVVDIQVSAIAYETKSFKDCPDLAVPFKEVVTVGNLQGGEYKVKVNSQTRYALEDSLKITEASSNAVDDYIYAAIDWVERTGPQEFILHGQRYSNCLVLDHIEVVSNSKDTLSILPVMKRLSDFCPMKMMPTKYPIKIDFSNLKIDRPLLHVRTMDGKSVNTVVNSEVRR